MVWLAFSVWFVLQKSVGVSPMDSSKSSYSNDTGLTSSVGVPLRCFPLGDGVYWTPIECSSLLLPVPLYVFGFGFRSRIRSAAAAAFSA